MKNEFIETHNVIKFNEICRELEDPASRIGPSLAMVSGPAGRGKTEAAKRLANSNGSIYIAPRNTSTPTMVLRRICFELCKNKPYRKEECFNVIQEEMLKERRLVIIDEADLLPIHILEMLRNLNEEFSFPILLMGESGLPGKIFSRRRLASRIRQSMEFGPIIPADILQFFRKALGLRLSPEAVDAIHKYSKGDWRDVLNLAVSIERAMKASSLSEVNVALVEDAIGRLPKKHLKGQTL